MEKNRRFERWLLLSRGVKNRWLKLYSKYYYDFVFIHINKTGGSSIEKALNLPFEHKTAVEKISELGDQAWGRKFSFTFVRNPWDKVVSQYHHRVRTNQTNLKDKPLEFNDWVILVFRENNKFYYNDRIIMFLPQWNWISDQGELIVDFIGRFEQLEDDFNLICNKINKQARLPHLKKSHRGHYRQYYNDESIEIVGQWFSQDIEIFNYEF